MIKKLSNPLTRYENKWVALTPDLKRVVVFASSAKNLVKKLEKIKNTNVVMTKVFPFDRAYSPYVKEVKIPKQAEYTMRFFAPPSQ